MQGNLCSGLSVNFVRFAYTLALFNRLIDARHLLPWGIQGDDPYLCQWLESGHRHSILDRAMLQEVQVEYAASDKCADTATLCAWIQSDIEGCFNSLTEPKASSYQLKVNVTRFESSKALSRLDLDVSGCINDQPIEKVISCSERRPHLMSFSAYMIRRNAQWRSKHSPVIVGIDRLTDCAARIDYALRPTPLVTAFGRPESRRRDILALKGCLAELHLAIDQLIGRKPVAGWSTYKNGRLLTIVSVIAGTIATIYFFAKSPGTPAESSLDDGACLAIAMGLPTLIYTGTLLSLPHDFFLGTRAGRQILKTLGLRSPATVRIVAGALCLLAMLAIAWGSYRLFLLPD